MRLTSKQQGHLIMLVVMSVFGINIPINKYLYAEHMLSPMAMTLLRMTFAASLFWIISLFIPKEKIAKKDMWILLIGGILGMTFNQGLFAFGLSRTSPVDAAIIATSVPLWAMLIAALVLKEPITSKKAGGVVLGALGAIFLVYSSHHIGANQEADTLGNMSIVCSSFFYAMYLVVTRPLSIKYSPVTMMKWMFLFSSITILPFSFSDVVAAPLFQQSQIKPFAALSFTLLGATFFTYIMIPLAQRRIRPTTISMYNNVQPIVATIIAISVGMDTLTLSKILASILIFAGVYLVTQSKSKADLDAETEAKSKMPAE